MNIISIDINNNNNASDKTDGKIGADKLHYSTCSSSSSTSHQTPKKWDIIKTNNGKQRISQLCDRCCIKKIKCDGSPGGCSNCIKIGFFCKTTDKLTRSSFPKGYTKTLEKQVVELELENKKIKLQLENLMNGNNNDGYKENGREKETKQVGNLMNFVNSVVVGNDNGDKNNDNTSNEINFNDDDDFFNFAKLLQPRQKLCGDFLSFDQLKTNPLIEYLTSEFNLPIPILRMSDHEVEDEDGFDFNHLLAKYIQPLLHQDASLLTNSILNNNKIDNLISKFFDRFNKLIPILDFKKFYNQYLNFFNKFDIENKDVDINFKFEEEDKIFIIKLLLIIKFNFNTSSIFNQEDHLNYQIFKFIRFKKLVKQIDFLEPNIEKLELILMLLNYLYQFELPKLEFNSFDLKTMNNWSYALLSLGLHYINTLGLNINTEELIIDIEDKETLIQHNFVRLKLYWSFRILLRSIKIKFNYNYKNLKLIKEDFEPSLLENVTVLESNLQYTIEYLKLIKIIPINFTQLLEFELTKVQEELVDWKINFESKFDLSQDICKELLSIYYQYIFMIDKSCSDDIICTNFEIVDLFLTYENKPKVTRGRKKKRSFSDISQNDESDLRISLIQRLNSLSNFERLLINEKLSLLDNNFKTVLLIACLCSTAAKSQINKVDKIHQIFEIGLVKKTPFESMILDRIQSNLTRSKSIDVSKEFNELHQSFTIHEEVCPVMSSPSSSSQTSSTFSNHDSAIDMSRNSSITTTATSFKMSRSPSLRQYEKGGEIEVESLFANHHQFARSSYNFLEGAGSSPLLFKDDEDLMRLKETVLSLTR